MARTTHAQTVELTHEPDPTTILLGYELGTAELPHDRTLSIVGSGSTLRFSVSGIRGHVDLDLSELAARAALILTEPRPKLWNQSFGSDLDACDRCGHVGELYYNEATELALCSDCDALEPAVLRMELEEASRS